MTVKSTGLSQIPLDITFFQHEKHFIKNNPIICFLLGFVILYRALYYNFRHISD